ncbi:uncharacterized protein TrAFT101_006754 [Trichoderma asperellum]|uniref:uncharacterized protein n=1 Tax=Trichoderma asperellum TaxID=101201 RepID=UPI00332DBA22|nr:hypothetical protein TrAFT101_006754 [Trichoderma asperellum]
MLPCGGGRGSELSARVSPGVAVSCLSYGGPWPQQLSSTGALPERAEQGSEKGISNQRSTEIKVEGDAPRLRLSLAPKCHLKTDAAGDLLKGPKKFKRLSPAGETLMVMLICCRELLLILRYTAACGMLS